MTPLIFYSLKPRVVNDVVNMPVDDFVLLINEYEPKLFFNSQYSTKKHLYEVLRYGMNDILYTCTRWADKTPQTISFGGFYKLLRQAGLSGWYTEPMGHPKEISV